MSGKKDKQEDDCKCYAQSRTPTTCPPIHNITHPLRYYEFTQDEIKALEECDKESFYHRCIPLSTLFATITYSAIKYGFVNRNPHFGAVPKVLVAVLLGHMVGRVLYSSHCNAKLRHLPANSKLGNLLRQYHKINNTPPDPKKR